MNKYIVSICDIQSGEIWIECIHARSISDCQDKLMEKLIDLYNFEETSNYREFVQMADSHDVLISDITDVETL